MSFLQINQMIEVLDKDGGGVVYALLTNYLTITKTNYFNKYIYFLINYFIKLIARDRKLLGCPLKAYYLTLFVPGSGWSI